MSSCIARTNQLVSLFVNGNMHGCYVYIKKHYQLVCNLISAGVKWTSDGMWRIPNRLAVKRLTRIVSRSTRICFEFRKIHSCHISSWKFGEHNMASVPVYCLCRLPYDVTRFMIECDICQDWFHGRWVFQPLYGKVIGFCIWNCYSQHHLCNLCEYSFFFFFLCSCVGVEEDKATEIDLYHCPNCQVSHGPSVSKSCRSPNLVVFMVFFSISVNKVSDPPSVLLLTVRKRRGGNKQTTDYSSAGVRDPSHPVKTGSPQFVRELRSRTFPK